MKPRRTHESTACLRLPGHSEDHDLWAQICVDDDDNQCMASVWEPTSEERAAIAAGANIELIVSGTYYPPVAVTTTTVELGKPPEASEHL